MRIARAARLLVLAAATAVIAEPVAAQSVSTIKVERVVGGKQLTLPVEIFLPKNSNGPVPAIVIMHGSSGVRDAREYAYASRFNVLGIAAVVVDSFGPRGVRSSVNNQSVVRETDMLADAVAVLEAIARVPAIDPQRIGLIGFSKGGSVTIKAALRRYMTGTAHFALLVALYPWCGELPLDFRPDGAPLVMLLGGNDTYAGTASCREFARKFEAAGGKLTLEVYAGAHHGFDVPGPSMWNDRRAQNSSKCVYEEVQPGRWVERSSRLVTFDNGAPTAEAKQARAACGTVGASGGYDAASAERSWRAISAAVRAAFRLD